ncbi:MAG: FHA domain-containing protein [Methanobacteriota archaeon]
MRDADPRKAGEAGADHRLTELLAALASEQRLALLRATRTPKRLHEIEVTTTDPADGRTRNLTRQTVSTHLEKLVEAGLVQARKVPRDQGETTEYVLNHQTVYAVLEELRTVAALRPTVEPEAATMKGDLRLAAGGEQGPCLILVKGLDEGTIFPLAPTLPGRARWVIGRRRGLPVSLDFDPFASAENSIVTLSEGSYGLEDLPTSRNGTMRNFRRLARGERAALVDGDVIGVGQSTLVFRHRP